MQLDALNIKESELSEREREIEAREKKIEEMRAEREQAAQLRREQEEVERVVAAEKKERQERLAKKEAELIERERKLRELEKALQIAPIPNPQTRSAQPSSLPSAVLPLQLTMEDVAALNARYGSGRGGLTSADLEAELEQTGWRQTRPYKAFAGGRLCHANYERNQQVLVVVKYCAGDTDKNGRFASTVENILLESVSDPSAIPSAASPVPVQQSSRLVRGSTQIKGIQHALKTLGFYSGAVDGLYGPGTTQAMTAWQAASRLPPTGHLTDDQFMAVIRQAGERPSQQSGTTAPFRWTNSMGQGTYVAVVLNDTNGAVRLTCTMQGVVAKAGPGLEVDVKPSALRGESLVQFVIDGKNYPITLRDGSIYPVTTAELNDLLRIARALMGSMQPSFSVEVPSRGATTSFSLANVQEALRTQDGKTIADCPAAMRPSGAVQWSDLLGGWLDTNFKCEGEDPYPHVVVKEKSLDWIDGLGEGSTCKIDRVNPVSSNTVRVLMRCTMAPEGRENGAVILAQRLQETRDPAERRKLSAEIQAHSNPNTLYPRTNDFSLTGGVLSIRHIELQENGQAKPDSYPPMTLKRCGLVK